MAELRERLAEVEEDLSGKIGARIPVSVDSAFEGHSAWQSFDVRCVFTTLTVQDKDRALEYLYNRHPKQVLTDSDRLCS